MCVCVSVCVCMFAFECVCVCVCVCMFECALNTTNYYFVFLLLLQWNPSITATIGEQHDGRYSGCCRGVLCFKCSNVHLKYLWCMNKTNHQSLSV